jgi:hypothetical protein
MTRIRIEKASFVSAGTAHKVFSSGTVVNKSWSAATLASCPAFEFRCDDFVNRKESDNVLHITKETRLFVPFNGTRVTGSFTVTLTEFLSTSMSQVISHPSGLESTIPSVGTVATAVIARSNPSRPDISIPNFLYELKDLPGMIRDIGRLKNQIRNGLGKGSSRINAKNAASHSLAYQMGWRPLISDLRKLLDFQAIVDKKMRTLQNLYDGDGLQRRVRSSQWRGTLSTTSTGQLAESVIDSAIVHRIDRFSQIERWGTVRWKPASLPDPRFSSKQMARLARDLAFGMNRVTAKQVWDAIPWTWLIGWFSNADEFIQAHSNAIPLVHSTPCIMTHAITKTTWTRTDNLKSVYLGGEGDAGYETKDRVINGGTLSASIPFLNGRQLSILGALAIQRKR